MSRGRALAIALGATAAIAGAIVFAIVCWPVRCTIYIDNGTDRTVMAGADDEAPVQVDAHDTVVVQVHKGARRLRATSGGQPVDEVTFTAERASLLDGKSYVFNVAGANRYAVYHTAYGSSVLAQFGAGRTPDPIGYDAHVFALPDDAPFADSFPHSVEVEKIGDYSPAVVYKSRVWRR